MRKHGLPVNASQLHAKGPGVVGTALKWGDVGWTGGELRNGKLGRHGSILQLLLPNSVVDFGTTRSLFPGLVLSFPPSPPGTRPNRQVLFLHSD